LIRIIINYTIEIHELVNCDKIINKK